MEKKIYEKPAMQVEAFIANDYCANCDSGVVYGFKCDVGIKDYGTTQQWDQETHQYKDFGPRGTLYYETNGLEGLQTRGQRVDGRYYEADQKIGGFHACNITHEASSTSDFRDGYFRLSSDHSYIKPVKIWNTWHATEELDPREWEILKS